MLSPRAASKSEAPVVEPSKNSVVLVTIMEPAVGTTLTTWTLYPAAFKGLSIADMNCSNAHQRLHHSAKLWVKVKLARPDLHCFWRLW